MLIDVAPAEQFGTNCCVLAPEAGSECLIVDPGISIPDHLHYIEPILERYKLKPIASLVTHGHLDHTFSVTPLCEGYGIPAYIHPQDRRLLRDPFAALMPGGPLISMMSQFGRDEFVEPTEVIEVVDGQKLSIAGLEIEILHAPGHTTGSIMFLINSEHLISGDVLFENGIGRTDLPTGSDAAMRNSLREKILPLDDAIIVHPGHGRETTIGRERKNSPYLQSDYLGRR